MAPTLPPSPTLTLYRRDGCHLCDDAERSLQSILEERVLRGELGLTVRHVDIDADPDVQRRYFERIPVVAVGADELALVTSARQLRAFLDRVLPRVA